MTLHEAMLEVIDKYGNIPVSKLVSILNETKLYTKKDLSMIKNSQIYARIGKYPNLFYVKDKCVYKK